MCKIQRSQKDEIQENLLQLRQDAFKKAFDCLKDIEEYNLQVLLDSLDEIYFTYVNQNQHKENLLNLKDPCHTTYLVLRKSLNEIGEIDFGKFTTIN